MYPLPPATVLRDAVTEGPRKIQMSEPRTRQEAGRALWRALPCVGWPEMGRGAFIVPLFKEFQPAGAQKGGHTED